MLSLISSVTVFCRRRIPDVLQHCMLSKCMKVVLQCRSVWNLEQAHSVHRAMQMNSVVQMDSH